MRTLREIICREIGERGVLSFARFMELALYCPDFGYYEVKKDNPGRHGDFYTSVSVGELFGQLLAFQFAEWLHEMRTAESKVQIVEAGAHDGRLAGDVLNWLQAHRPQLYARLEYYIIEPSARRQEWQKEALKNLAPHIRWVSRFGDSTAQRYNGIIFSNELIDAMPVHRFGWDAGSRKWFEWGVRLDSDKFVWTRMENSEFGIGNSELESVLPDGYTIETCPAAEHWWREAASSLQWGRLLTIDYGLTEDKWISPARTRGTLRAYYRHRATDDVLANVGEQDLTAHVNFSALQGAGESCGLKTEGFSTQAQFLVKIAGKIFKAPESFGNWGPKETRQFQTLTHPEHLGHAFRALVQSKG